jgi:hypothetical protein
MGDRTTWAFGMPCVITDVAEDERFFWDYTVRISNPWSSMPLCRSVPSERIVLAGATDSMLRELSMPWPIPADEPMQVWPKNPKVICKEKQMANDENVVRFNADGNPEYIENDRTREIAEIKKPKKSRKSA